MKSLFPLWRLGLLASLVLPATALRADVKLPAIFGDHMVLQQDGKIPVWGTATPGEIVTVTLGSRTASIIANPQGKWRIDLPPFPFTSTSQKLTVSGRNQLVFTDVLVGDVWLAAGQSNMEYGIGNDIRGRDSIAKSDDPQLRLFTIPSNATTSPLDDFGSNGRTQPQDLVQGKWQVCTPDILKLDGPWNGFSAVAYYFGHDLRAYTRRPVGLISTTRGGTRIEPWISLEGLKQPPAFTSVIADYEQKSSKPDGGGSLGPGVPNMPASIYNATIAPLVPYALKGVIWYQGESNADRPSEYAPLFTRLITDWRAKWAQGDLPFLFVQLAAFNGNTSQEDWARLRETQLKALALPATGTASAVDIGNPRDIHPNDKIDVGARLALAGRHVAYDDKSIVFSGPTYESGKLEAGGKVRLNFKNTGGGLVIGTPPANFYGGNKPPSPASELTGFMMADARHDWHPAQARIESNTVLVWSDEVPKPAAIRYAWANAPAANLYNREGLPATPFRTDDWPRIAEPVHSDIGPAAAWEKECAERVASFKNKPCDVIFIGDSITQNFIETPKNGWNLVGRAVWDKYYAGRRYLDFGVGGDGTQNALWRMDHMDIKDLRPKVAVVMLGMNNQNETPEDIAGGVKAVIDRARVMFPGVKIIAMSVTANGRMPEKTPKINDLLKTFADDQTIFYVDLYSKMTPTGPHSWKGVGGDQVHLTPEGYELWAAALEPTLQKLLGP